MGLNRHFAATISHRLTAWWARQDLNLQPDRYERAAVSSKANFGERTKTMITSYVSHL